MDFRPRRSAAELFREGSLLIILLVPLLASTRLHMDSFAVEASAADDARKPSEAPRAAEVAEPGPTLMAHEAIEARRQEQVRLEDLLAHNPGDLELRIQLAAVMAERRFLREAVRQLERVLDADPSRADIWRRRAVLLREIGLVREEREPLVEALSCYQKMLQLASRDASGAEQGTADDRRQFTDEDLLAAAGLALALGEPQTTEALTKEILPAANLAPLAELLGAAAAYKMGRLEEAATRTDQVRANLGGELAAALSGSDLAGIEEERDDLAPVGTQLASLPGAADRGFVALAAPASIIETGVSPPASPQAPHASSRLQRFWKSQDPTPTTAINERYLEHCYRILVSDALYSRPGVPGRDTDRGRSFIRYGSPAKQRVDGADFAVNLIKRKDNIGIYRDPKTRLVYPRITWTYEVGRESFDLVFEDLTLLGDFHYADASAQRAVRLARELPSLFVREVPGGLVRIAEAQTCFLRSQKEVLVSIAAALPVKELLGGASDSARSSWAEVEVRWAVFDPTWRTVAERAMRLEAAECVYRDAEGRAVLLARADFDLPAGDYIMATEFRDPVSGREGMVRREVRIEPIQGLLSEIELVREVNRTPAGSGVPFARYDAQVIPNPRREVAAGDPLRFYYEIYRAVPDPDGLRRCRIVQRVRNLSAPKGGPPVYPLEFTFEIEEPVHPYEVFMPRVGGIDISSLRAGRYELELRVEDLVGGKTSERKIGFVKRS